MTSISVVQFWGVLTKAVTVALGILQTAIILRFLSPAEYGIIGIVVSLGSLVGVSQHVGIVDAAIREIAMADTPRRRAHIFWVSLWFRLAVTVPISLALAMGGAWIGARVYPLPDVPHLVRLMSLILILQGFQGVVGGAYTGQRAFRQLYLLQLLMAVVNVPLFTVGVWWHGVAGFFEAVVVSTFLFIVMLAVFLREALGGTLAHPNGAEALRVLREILHTGVWTYVARILSVSWQRVPLLLLARWATPDVVGLFNVALTFGSKLVILASALGEVNLAFLSHAFAKSRQTFAEMSSRTLENVGAAILLAAGFLVLFTDVLLRVFAGAAYKSAAGATLLVTSGYAMYAFLDIATNTTFVPARRAHDRALAFLVLFLVTMATMVALRPQPLRAAAVSVVLGSGCALLVANLLAKSHLRLTLFPRSLPLLLIPGVLFALGAHEHVSLFLRAMLYGVLAGGVMWLVFPAMFKRALAWFKGDGEFPWLVK